MTSTAAPILAALRRFWAYLLPSSLVDFFAVANLDDEHYVGRLDRVDNAPILYTQPPCTLEAVPQRLAKLDGVRCEFPFYGPPDSVANVLVDLSKVVLTHHHLRNLGKRTLPLQVGDKPLLDPIEESGSGMVREPEKVYLAEVIAKLNEVFGDDTTVDDQLVYVNHVLLGKLMESETLRQQATSNTKEQFGNFPDLNSELMNAVMDAQEAHNTMSTKALNSAAVLAGIKDILLNHSRLWETLRGQRDT